MRAILQDYSVFYIDNEVMGLDCVTLAISQGQACSVLGFSGSGKTTLCLSLADALEAQEGLVRIGGTRAWYDQAGWEIELRRRRHLAGLVLQDPWSQLTGFARTCQEEVAVGLALRQLSVDTIDERVEIWLERVGLSDLRSRETNTLSGGEVQRLILASFLALEPELLILDEPLAHLDPDGRKEISGILAGLAQHRLASLVTASSPVFLPKYSSRQYTLHQGQLTAGIDGRLRGRTRKKPYIPSLKTHSRDVPLEMHDVSVTYPNGIQALRDIALMIEQGQTVALVGPNGSGKTTMLKAIAGLVIPSIGDILIRGRRITAMSPNQRAKLVGIAFQNPKDQIFRSTVVEEIAVAPKIQGISGNDLTALLKSTLELLALEKYRDVHPYDLSAANLRLLAVAIAISHRPPLLLLDEPTAGLDPPSLGLLGDVLVALRNAGYSIVLVSHDEEFANKISDRSIRMAEGRIIP